MTPSARALTSGGERAYDRLSFGPAGGEQMPGQQEGATDAQLRELDRQRVAGEITDIGYHLQRNRLLIQAGQQARGTVAGQPVLSMPAPPVVPGPVPPGGLGAYVALTGRRRSRLVILGALAGLAAIAAGLILLVVRPFPRNFSIPAVSSATWTLVNSPNTGSGGNNLHSVACSAPGACWAVGAYSTSASHSPDRTLIEQDTQSGWVVVSSPDVGSGVNELWSLACPSLHECWAVGEYFDVQHGINQTLIEYGSGSPVTWNVVSSPDVGSVDNELSGVACPGPDDCWAVGQSGYGVNPETLIEHNTGSGWVVVSSPNVGSIASDLDSVACPTVDDCWAVGVYSYQYGVQHSLVEHYSGGDWAVVDAPNPGSVDNWLDAVACVDPAHCWAVGYFAQSRTASADQFAHTLIVQYIGGAWGTVDSSNLFGDLEGVT